MTNNDVQKIISETAEATAKAIYNKIQLEAKKAKAEAEQKTEPKVQENPQVEVEK